MRFILFLLPILIFLTSCSSDSNNVHKNPTVINGFVDLQSVSFETKDLIPLNGSWNLYWNERLQSVQNHSQNHDYINLPGLWNGLEVKGEKLPSQGYATFHLSVQLNDDDLNRTLGLYIPYIHTAYAVYIDGELKVEVGSVGDSKETSKPKYSPNSIFFTPAEKTFDIIIQASNFHHTKGGLSGDILIGNAEALTLYTQKRVANNLFLFGCFLIIAIYHISIYMYRREEVTSFVFGLFSLLIGIRMLLIDQAFLVTLFPTLNWGLEMRLEYVTNYGGFFLFLIFLKQMYPLDVHYRFYRVMVVITGLFTSLVLLTTPYIFTYIFNWYTVLALFLILYFAYVLIVAAIRKRESALISAVAGLFFYLTITNDLLYNLNIIQTGNYLPLGFLVFIVSQSLVMSIQYSKTFKQVAKLNEQLSHLNESLEDKVQERTETLKNTMRETAAALAEKSALEERNQLIRDIHDTVGHTLTTIIVQIEAGKRLIKKDPLSAVAKLDASQQQVRTGLDDIRRILKIIKTAELSDNFLDSIRQLIANTEKTTGVTIETEIVLNGTFTSQLRHVLFRALQEGLTNGIRHGQSNSFIFKLYDSNVNVHFYLKDNGNSPEEFEMGLGLTAMKERVDELGGTFELDTADGFTIHITLPK
ncbi:sensor histidine kinase [Alkalihalobacillus sp. MEB130]|uniref:sensor histidine kinase n=1 Tax=Alkalihalobacillus sp. MEB130 TaxID=2976704 RepID=UPI0028DD6D3C|nr:sensor histidine kinase [Alkalihalobacillus sp. MEB130]MDT8861169.1 sensor histidine kinase [Alkalihalobacillus sp. MEB130]